LISAMRWGVDPYIFSHQKSAPASRRLFVSLGYPRTYSACFEVEGLGLGFSADVRRVQVVVFRSMV